MASFCGSGVSSSPQPLSFLPCGLQSAAHCPGSPGSITGWGGEAPSWRELSCKSKEAFPAAPALTLLRSHQSACGSCNPLKQLPARVSMAEGGGPTRVEGAGLAFWWCVEGHRGQGSSQEPRAVTAAVLRG